MIMEPSAVETRSRHRNHHKRERHNSPRQAAVSLAEIILKEEARRPGAGLRRLRTTSLNIDSSSGMPSLPDGDDDLGRARPRHCAPKKKGAGRAGWGSIKDEIRMAQTHLDGDAPLVASTASSTAAAATRRQRRRTRSRSRTLSVHSGNDSDGISDDLEADLASVEGSLQDGSIVFSVVTPECSAHELVRTMRPVLEDYLEHGQVAEVLHVCHHINVGAHATALVREALQQGLERKDDSRELVSELLCELLEDGVIAELDIGDAFDALLGDMVELMLDVPEAPTVLGKFIARAVVDNCIGGDYVTDHAAPENSHAIVALSKAATLLSIPNTRAHMKHIWGIHCKRCPLKTTIEHITYLLKEYFSSGDKDEAERCLKELGVPHFHHEVVYELLLLTLQDGHTARVPRMAMALLTFLSNTGDISEDQMAVGFRRVMKNIDDIVLDIPRAHAHLEQLVHRAAHLGLISASIADELPSRSMPTPSRGMGGRRRYVSENDRSLYRGDSE